MAGVLSAAAPEARPLPPLREDLRLMPGPRGADGAPTWTLHDPAANRFLRIGWLEFEILQRWGLGSAAAVAAAVRRATPIAAQEEDVLEVARFAARCELLQSAEPAGSGRLARTVEARRVGAAKWLLKNYLFVRIPLLAPDRFLTATLPLARRLFSRGFLAVVALAALLGLYLIGRQWDTFTHSFLHLLTLDGIVLGGGALLVAKVVHEFGHAYAARLAGCRVPAMGMAFMVMVPVLWTDTTDAWRLTSRRRRMLIDAGGMLAELTLAAFAALAWSVLPDGGLRTGVFLLASTSWVMTLAINLNPLMRFDGYFLLSDALDLPNLQDRAFALGRHWLRETLFGFGDPPPEHPTPGRRRFMIGYALAIWVYRFSLFLGIALLVYAMFFKLLGVFLMAVEIGWFIVRPVVAELRVWAARRRDLRWNARSVTTLAAASLLLAAFLVPWRTQVTAPAVLKAERQAVLYALHPGRIASMPDAPGATIAEKAAAFVLDSPDLGFRIAQAERRVRLQQTLAIAQQADPEQASRLPLTWQEMESAAAELETLAAQKREMTVRAPFAGRLAELPEHLRPGAWVAAREPLGLLVADGTTVAEGFVTEAEVARIAPGAPARFIPDDGGPELPLRLESIDVTAAPELETPELATTHGGGVAVRPAANGKLIPAEAVYRIVLAPAASLDIRRTLRGTVVVEGRRSSWLERLRRNAYGLLIRESGW
ncbi:HlyD family efflux transporter periplasmic adaptor subunit [Azospirillum sp.]|uniref:HlyD family efflux transporter periplasmic adaptor subunit n=1 Tax=Azospirillum sp. TaxID=34012 RepID=UPI003D722A3B